MFPRSGQRLRVSKRGIPCHRPSFCGALLDLAFNNAGTEQFGQFIVELAEEEWQRVMAINLKSVFLAMKHQIPAMRAAGGGAIVNTSSDDGLVATPGLSAYQASKFGVIGLTRVLASPAKSSSP